MKKIDKSKLERRTMKISIPEPEKRFEDGQESSQPMILEGYAVVFEQEQTYTFGERTYTEVIKRGALDNANMKRTVLRYNHEDTVFALARVKNGSLQLIVDDYGLKIRAELLDTQSNRDLYKMVQAGLIDEMSFAFTVAAKGDAWTYSDDWNSVYREIKAIDTVYDVSVVDNGFYEMTSVYARAFEDADALKEESEMRKLEIEKARVKALAAL